MSDTPFKIIAIGVGIKLNENPRLLPHLTAAAPTRRELTHAIGNEIFDGDDAEARILSIGLNQRNRVASGAPSIGVRATTSKPRPRSG